MSSGGGGVRLGDEASLNEAVDAALFESWSSSESTMTGRLRRTRLVGRIPLPGAAADCEPLASSCASMRKRKRRSPVRSDRYVGGVGPGEVGRRLHGITSMWLVPSSAGRLSSGSVRVTDREVGRREAERRIPLPEEMDELTEDPRRVDEPSRATRRAGRAISPSVGRGRSEEAATDGAE